jgi:arylsulfatase A-like enzyme/Flp pilus assembly protein TadD
MKAKISTRFSVFLLAMIFVIVIGTLWFLRPSPSPANKIHNVLLISIDTCRADYLSCYGYPRKITPNVDAFAAEGTVFENTISPVPITLPAHSSMLTGTIPPHHGVHDNSDYQLDQSNVTLAEMLKHRGFTTGGIISAFVLDSAFGIDQGFDTYNDRFQEERVTAGDISERIGAETSRFALNWLGQHKNEKFFLFLHYFDPHGDYVPPEPFASQFAHNPYAGEIAYTDHCIGLVLSKLKELGLYDSTLIIITSDHGEMLGEHGELSHLYFIYQSAIKVPLIFRLPGQRKAKRIKELVGIVDIAPTVCGLLDIEVPQNVQGQDLSGCLLAENPPDRARHIYCESLFATRYNAGPLLGMVTNRFKYIQTARPELYDLLKDPYETNNLINEQPQQASILRDRLKQKLEQSVRKGRLDSKIELDARSRQRLESLGYVAGAIIEDFDFDQTGDDPKDLIDFHNLNLKVPALIFQEMYEEAKVSAEKLVRQRPDCRFGYGHLAEIARKQKDYSTAAVHLNKVLELNPNDAKTHNNMGTLLELQTRLDDAISHYRIALQIDPDYPGVHNNLGNALVRLGNPDKTITFLTEATQLNPNIASTHYILARELNRKGRTEEAIIHFEKALRIRPNWQKPMNSLAWILATHSQDNLRNPAKAIQLAQRACELANQKNAGFLDTLAAAYAAAGRFDDAAATAEKAVQLIASGDNKQRLQKVRERLELYRQGKPYRKTPYGMEQPK